jgi:rSAM/selenodomain-associated transferase 1
MRPTLVIFVKEPRPGRVKTRLARGIGVVEAAWWFRHGSARLIRTLGRDPRWRTLLAVTPDAEGMHSRVWPPGPARAPQGPGDLGRRMTRFLRAEAGTGIGSGPVVVVGADLPELAPAHIAGAFRLLGRHEAVLGPATDGGYWLIGLARRRAVPPRLLDGVRWSTRHALADTAGRLRAFSVAFATTLRDVDTAADLAALGRRDCIMRRRITQSLSTDPCRTD